MHFGARFGLTPYFFLGGAEPEVISGQLYAGAEVDIWSCEYLYNISLSIYIYIKICIYVINYTGGQKCIHILIYWTF